jgi:hypothetical protein
MKIHLIRSQDVERGLLSNVYDLLVLEDGPAQFIKEDHSISFRGGEAVLSWKMIFDKCAEYRTRHTIPSDDFMILLTSKSTEENWFSCPDPNGARSIFIHTTELDDSYLIDCEPHYPIAFQCWENLLHALMFRSLEEGVGLSHDPPIGCITDLCSWKPGGYSVQSANGEGAFGYDDIDVGIDQRHRKFRKSRNPTIAPLRDENEISSLHVVFLAQSTQKGFQVVFGRRCRAQISDAPYALRLLPMRRERPRSRAPQKRDELAPSQMIEHRASAKGCIATYQARRDESAGISGALATGRKAQRPLWVMHGCGRIYPDDERVCTLPFCSSNARLKSSQFRTSRSCGSIASVRAAAFVSSH